MTKTITAQSQADKINKHQRSVYLLGSRIMAARASAGKLEVQYLGSGMWYPVPADEWTEFNDDCGYDV